LKFLKARIKNSIHNRSCYVFDEKWEWYKEIKPQSKNNLEFNEDGGLKMNPKYCIPLFDSLSSGYTVELSCDIFYEWYNDNKNKIDNLSQNDFDDIILGNITKRVRRNLNLDKLL
jgi:hypothetical protein